MKKSAAAHLLTFLGLAVSADAQIPTPSFNQIAGYFARNDVTEFLERDLKQVALEDAVTGIGDETCASFDARAQSLYDDGNWNEIPTYRDSKSDAYEEYTRCYGTEDWVDHWATRAIRKTRTTFSFGNADFGDAFPNDYDTGGDCVGFEEVLKKGLSYAAQVAEMLQLGQKARDAAARGCRYKADGCTDATEAWDAAVAVFVGSLEGHDGDNDPGGRYGKAPYALADKLCRNFKNCGPDLNEDTKDITANINTKILSIFSAGSLAAWEGDYRQLEKYIRLISNKVAVPFIQGVFRYYYRLSNEERFPNFSTLDKEVAEGGAFMFGVGPKLRACSKRGYRKAESQTKIGGGIAGVSAVNFQDIKLAFECNYRCLGITCEEVGALYDSEATPKPGAEPCDDEVNGSDTTCARRRAARRTQCRLFVGQPGVKGRNKLRFSF